MSDIPYKSYIICTSPRSGSTLLCKLLAATQIAGNPDSHFHTPSIMRWLETYQLDRENYASEQAALRAIYDAAHDRGSAGTGIFGLRMQRESFAFFMQQTALLYPAEKSDLGRIQAAFGRTMFIHLTRSNKLDQAISIVKATQSGLWHRAADGSELQRLSEPQELQYDASEIARHMDILSAMDLAWLEWFEQQNIQPMRVCYDALSSEPNVVLAAILDSLGLDSHAAQSIEPPVRKLADDINRDWAARFTAEKAGC